MSNRETAETFLQLCATGHAREAFDKHVGRGFRHHNTHFKGDADSLMEAMEADVKKHPEKTCSVFQSVAEGATVATHSHVCQTPGSPGAAVVHIFRFDGDKIVELWDVGQEVPKRSKNDNGMF